VRLVTAIRSRELTTITPLNSNNSRILAAGQGNSGRISAVVWSLIATLSIWLSWNTGIGNHELLREREEGEYV